MTDIVSLAKPKVLICFDEEGCFSVVSDIPCDVICVDERSPSDRAYRMQQQPYGRQLVRDIIGPSEVGHYDDQQLSPEEVAEIQKFFDG